MTSCVLADRGPLVHREDLPLPTEPPYTAFVGNLAFDLTDMDLEEFFTGIEAGSSTLTVLPPNWCTRQDPLKSSKIAKRNQKASDTSSLLN